MGKNMKCQLTTNPQIKSISSAKKKQVKKKKKEEKGKKRKERFNSPSYKSRDKEARIDLDSVFWKAGWRNFRCLAHLINNYKCT